MDLRKIKKLIELVEESGIAELEVRNGDEQVRIAMPQAAVPAVGVAAPPAVAAPAAGDESRAARSANGTAVAAPMSGTFYRAPAPGEPPFVEIGGSVKAGDVLCIIESMKMMHQIEAEMSGTVTDILIENGQPIETGTALLTIA